MAVGSDPLSPCANVFHHIESVIAAKKRAVVAKAAERGTDKFEARRKPARAQEVRDQVTPETGQRFVIAAVIGIRGAHASVVVDDAGANLLQSFVDRVVEEMTSSDGNVGGVGPFAFGESAGTPLIKEAV